MNGPGWDAAPECYRHPPLFEGFLDLAKQGRVPDEAKRTKPQLSLIS